MMIVPLVLLLALGTQLGNGCVSDTGGSGDGTAGYRPPPDELDGRRPRRIPRSADVVREGYEKLLWRADMTGRYYVYDVTNDRIVHDAPIARGQELYLDAKRDRVSVDGKDVPGLDVKKDGYHRIYFTSSRTTSRDDEDDDRDDDDRDDDDRDDSMVHGPQPPSPPAGLPRGALRLASGRGNLAIHAAPGDGTVYVYEETSQRVIHHRDLKRGNSFQIFPAEDYVNVNSRQAAEVRMSSNGRYSLYFAERR